MLLQHSVVLAISPSASLSTVGLWWYLQLQLFFTICYQLVIGPLDAVHMDLAGWSHVTDANF